MLLLLLLLIPGPSTPLTFHRFRRNLDDIGEHEHQHQQLDADDPDFAGVVDFSKATPGPGGSWCITKTDYVDHMVKDDVKECWHQNVTQCHDTYVTEFKPSQEQKCEETFWKSCKIDFREMPYNYTMKQCHIPLMKTCDSDPAYGKPEVVCKTWFESECNTTFSETTPNVEDKPNTWCKKVPRKICAPDNCKMVPGPEQCTNKVLVDTVQKPTEVCDLQPQQHCKLITKLTPHLLSKEVCKDIPKEVCHMGLSAPKNVRKPITLKWCTRKNPEEEPQQAVYRPQSYLPPPPTRTKTPPAFNPPQQQPPQQQQPPLPQQHLQNFEDTVEDNAAFASDLKVTKFLPPTAVNNNNNNNNNNGGGILSKKFVLPKPEPEAAAAAVVIKDEEESFQPVFQQEQLKPLSIERQSQSIQLPEPFRAEVEKAGLLKEEKKEENSTESKVNKEEKKEEPQQQLEQQQQPEPAAAATPVSITDDLTGEEEFSQGSFLRRRRQA